MTRTTDSSISVVFQNPFRDTIVPHSTANLPVAVQVLSKLHIGSVTVRGTGLTRTSDTAIWTAPSIPAAVGRDTLWAVATAGARKDSGSRVVIRRDTVAKPVFSPKSGSYTGAQPVSLSAPPAGDTIEYFVTGLGWTRWTGSQISVSQTGKLRARAFGPLTDTAWDSATYTITSIPPVIGPKPDTYSLPFKVGLTGAKVFYSFNDTDWQPYTDSVSLTKTSTVYAYDSVPGQLHSAVDSAHFVLRLPKPTFRLVLSPDLEGVQFDTLVDSLDGTTIQFTKDTSSWSAKSSPVVLQVDGSSTWYARATKSGWAPSLWAKRTYAINAVEVPLVSPPSGTYTETQYVWISTKAQNYRLQYSLDSLHWMDFSTGIHIDTPVTVWARIFFQTDTLRAKSTLAFRAPVPNVDGTDGPGWHETTITRRDSNETFQYSIAGGAWTPYTGAFRSTDFGTLLIKCSVPKWRDTILTSTLNAQATGFLTDSRDGAVYYWIKIGTQFWMTTNLAYRPKGDTGSWCYMDQASNCTTYGAMYTWSSAMGFTDTSYNSRLWSGVAVQRQGICPSEWHLPSSAEFAQLVESYKTDSVNAGSNFKAHTTWGTETHYDYEQFGALSSGEIQGVNSNLQTASMDIGISTRFWTTQESSANKAQTRVIRLGYNDMITDDTNKNWGVSVRCLSN